MDSDIKLESLSSEILACAEEMEKGQKGKETGVDKFMKGVEEVYENGNGVGEDRKKALYRYTFDFLSKNCRNEVGEIDFSARTYREDAGEDAKPVWAPVDRVLGQYLVVMLEAGKNLKAMELIKFNTKVWTDVRKISESFRTVCLHLKDNMASMRSEGSDLETRNNVKDVYRSALITFIEAVYEELHFQATRALVELIEKEKEGKDNADKDLIRGVVESYLRVGVESSLKVKDDAADSTELKELMDPQIDFELRFAKRLLLKKVMAKAREAGKLELEK